MRTKIQVSWPQIYPMGIKSVPGSPAALRLLEEQPWYKEQKSPPPRPHP